VNAKRGCEVMSRHGPTVPGDEPLLTLEELCRVAAVEPAWILHRVEVGLLAAAASAEDPWRFEPDVVERARCMWRIERDFDAVPELAALMADMEAEIRHLRARLRAAGLL
jgi:chaperone modulatory protein CbpM